MNLVFALATGTIFGTGAYLLLHRDLVRVVLGIVLISQAAVLTLIASGLTRGAAPRVSPDAISVSTAACETRTMPSTTRTRSRSSRR